MALRARPHEVRTYEPRFIAHPFELTLALMALVAVYGTVRVLLTADTLPPVGLLALPHWLLWSWIVVGTAGALAVIVSLAWGITRARARAVEQAGLWLTAATWTSVGVAVFVIDPSQIGQWGQYLAVLLGCALRLRALARVEKAVDTILRDQREGR